MQYLSNTEVITDIIHGVRNNGSPVFSYFDSSYNGSTNSLSQPVSVLIIRLIKINLTIDDDPNRPPSPMTITTEINFRNLKDNL